MGAIPSNGLPHPGTVEGKSLQNMLNHSGAKRLSMSATIGTAEANIVVQKHKPNVDWGKQSGVLVAIEKENVAEADIQFMLAECRQDCILEAGANKEVHNIVGLADTSKRAEAGGQPKPAFRAPMIAT